MSNFNDVIPIIYQALDVVSRELVGFIPAVSRDSTAERAAKDQTVRSHVVPAITTEDITPGDTPADSGDVDIDSVELTISKAKAAPVRWTAEEQRGVQHSGQYEAIQRDRFAQAMRALVNEVEKDVGGLFVNASRAYGTAGSTPFASDLSAVAEILKIMKDNGAPTNALKLVFDTSAGANLRSLAQLTNANQAGTDRTLRQGTLLDIHGFELRESAGVNTQDNDDETATGTVKTKTGVAHEVGDTEIAIEETDASAVVLIAGNYITIGDHKYMVTEGQTSITSSTGEIKIAAPGLMEDVAAETTITQNNNDFVGNLAFAQSAIHLVTRAPAMPSGGDSAVDVIEVTDPMSGLAFQVAMYRQYRRIKYEVGLAWGMKAIKPEHMAVLLG